MVGLWYRSTRQKPTTEHFVYKSADSVVLSANRIPLNFPYDGTHYRSDLKTNPGFLRCVRSSERCLSREMVFRVFRIAH